MELVDWDRVKAVTLETANKYSITLTVFHRLVRKPKLATGTIVRHNTGECVRTERESHPLRETDIVGLSGAPIFQAVDRPKLVGLISEGAVWSLEAQKIFAVHIETLDRNGRITA